MERHHFNTELQLLANSGGELLQLRLSLFLLLFSKFSIPNDFIIEWTKIFLYNNARMTICSYHNLFTALCVNTVFI